MADRFPSLDEIDAGQTEARGEVSSFENANDDFLTRERAALGDDADQFATANDKLATTVADVDDDDDDLLGGGGGGSYQANNSGAQDLDFNDSFPAIDTSNDHMAPGGTITGTSMPFLPGAPSITSYSAPHDNEPEPEVIREWRERRDLQVSHRDEVSNNRKQETIKQAHEQIDGFYENYNNKKEKQIAQTRREAEEFLKSREDTTAGGTSWERIAKLVDLSGKGTRGGASGSEKQRFREMLLSLRKDEKAPGATGY